VFSLKINYNIRSSKMKSKKLEHEILLTNYVGHAKYIY